MLLVLSAPVLAYAASMLKITYNATTGEISGIIYSDQKDIALSLDNGGEAYPVSSGVLGEVYFSDSANVYWAKVNGQIAPGLIPGNLTVSAGDNKQLPASVTGSVYSFKDSPLFDAPQLFNEYLYDFQGDGTLIYFDWRPVDDYGGLFGLSHYKVYDNSEFIVTTTDNSTGSVDVPFSRLPKYHYHSLHNFQVSAVDWLGNESAKSEIYSVRAPGLMKEAAVVFNGAKGGAKLQPLDGLISFTPYSENLPSDPAEGFRLQLTLPDAQDYNYKRAPYKVNEAQLSANDFELVKADGTIVPVQTLSYLDKETFKFTFAGSLDSSANYTLRLSKDASGDEIALPVVNTRQARANLYLEVGPAGDAGYKYSSYNTDISIGTFPDIPTGLKAEAGNGTLNISWNSSTEADLAGYMVWLDGKLLTESPIQKTNFFIDGLINGKTYHVNVAAVNKEGGRSLQAYILLVPKAPDGGSTGPGPGPGPGPGTGTGPGAAAGTDGTAARPAPVTVITVVDKGGTAKSLDAALKSEDSKVTVSVASDIKQLLMPAAADVINKDNTLVVNKDDLSLQIPGQVLEQLKGLVQADQLKNARISVVFNALTSDDIAKETAQSAAKSANTSITAAGAAFDISLSLMTADGKETKLTEFNLPVTLTLKVNEVSNPDLIGIYYMGNQGELEYLGGWLNNGYLTADTSHFSKYAVLQYDKTFSDVPSSHWASEAIKSMIAQHVATGTSDVTFSPNQQVTRAEFAVFIARKLGFKASGESQFTDVSSSKWYADEISAVAEAGIVSGKSETVFAPDLTISRQEMVVMLMKAYAYKYMLPSNAGEDNHPFADYSEIAAWAKPFATEAYRLGLVQGRSGNKFEPHKNATRAEAVQLISKL